MPETMREHYKEILEEISDTLEGGDIALDFEERPYAMATIGCIMAIVSNALSNMRDEEKIWGLLRREE